MRFVFMSAIARRKMPLRLALLIFLIATCCHAASKKVTAVDFTRPHNPAQEGRLYNVGPTGMLGMYNAATRSNQIRVRQVAKGSPADGKLIPGDVITGVNGVPFKLGGNIIVTLGNAIDEAEKKEHGGKIRFTVWRDANFTKRNEMRQISASEIDVSDLIEVIDADTSADLERHRSEHQLKESAAVEWKEAYEKIPIKESTRQVTLTLEVMGSYSETSPWDCPKIKKIRERAYPHLVRQMQRGIGGWDRHMIPLALLASDRPEHVELVKKEMHKKPNAVRPHGRTWFNGYNITFMGEYVNRTGDKAFVPRLQLIGQKAAGWQSIGGTWGHGSSNTKLRWADPYGPRQRIWCSGNYGAMNQAGGPCFFGMALAKKAGIHDPEIDGGIARSLKFNSTWVDKGGCPYGFHGAVGKETNNGKNGPLAPAMRLLGENYKAKYNALWCAVEASHGYTSGHGDGTFGRLWPMLAAAQAGPEVVQTVMKRLRPYYTMSRQHDGTFVSPASGMGLGIGSLFDPTAMAVLHFSIPLGKLYMTGRDLHPDCIATARDLQHLEDRLNRLSPAKLSDAGLIDRLDTWHPGMRDAFVNELVKRHQAGNTGVLPKVKKLVDHEDARVRQAALNVLAKCGRQAMAGMEPAMIERISDPVEIVRIAAIRAVASYAGQAKGRKGPLDLDRFLKPLVDAAANVYPDETIDTVNSINALFGLLVGTDNAFARDPFGQGLDPEKVRFALERFLLMDPRGPVPAAEKNWDRETCIRMAGPIMYVAIVDQWNCKMFGGYGKRAARKMLEKHKLTEYAEVCMDPAYVLPRLPISWRKSVLGSRMRKDIGYAGVKGMPKSVVPSLRDMLIENINASAGEVPFGEVIRQIEDYDPPSDWISMGEAATKAFLKKVDALGSRETRIALCRSVLEQTEGKDSYRKIGAMTRLVEYVGPEAVLLLAPYMIHDDWRMADHSRALLRGLKVPGAAAALVRLTEDKDPIAVAALKVLAERGDREGAVAGLKIVSSHKNPWVRGVAAQAIYSGAQGSNKAIVKLLTLMKGLKDPKEIDGYEEALSMGMSDPKQAQAIVIGAKKIMPACDLVVRKRLYSLIVQAGGTDTLQYLKGRLRTLDLKALDKEKREPAEEEFAFIIEAISRSPDASATEMMLQILKEYKGTKQAAVVSTISERRLVNGAGNNTKLSDEACLDFAEAQLKVYRNTNILAYLGNITSPRTVNMLFDYMKLGPAGVTETSAKSIDLVVSRFTKDMPLETRKATAQVLTQVLEYITQVHFGGGRSGNEEWQLIADSISNNLRRLYNPEEMIRHVAPEDVKGEDVDL